MIFSELHCGSNFGDVKLDDNEVDLKYENEVGGKHGIGISTVTILSKEFKIEIANPENKRKFKQTFTNNAQTCSEPKITDYSGDPYVQIEYELEFERFDDYTWDEVAINHLKWMTINMSFTLNLDFIFNGESVYLEDDDEEGDRFTRFGKLYFPVADNDHIAIFHNKHCSVIIADTLNEGKQISFVNTLYLQNNGAHVEKVVEAVGRKFLDQVKTKYVEKFGTGKEDSPETKAAKKSAAAIFKINRFTESVSFIVIVNMPNPRFTGGQIKEGLQEYPYDVEVPDGIFKKMEKWSFLEALNDIIDNKVNDALKSTDGKRNSKRPNLGPSVTHAVYAGDKNKKADTMLFLNEGKSAKQASDVIASLIPGGTNLVGSLPLRGKILNVRKNKKIKRELANKEIFEIKQMLGLQEGDTDPELLRYGKVVLLCDSDVDGAHVSSLLLNLFHYRWPKLIKKGFIIIKWTPQIVAKKGKQMKFFYTEADFDEWEDRKGWKILYKKGLGSLLKEEIKHDMKDPQNSIFKLDSMAGPTMNKFFHDSFSDDRKTAILEYIPKSIKLAEKIKVSEYLDSYLIQYSVDDLRRCLPRFEDNLKPSTRKIIWAAIKIWKYSKSKSLTSKPVSSFSGFMKDVCYYHHGEKSAEEAIISLAQTFVGANNLFLFFPAGLFGSRKEGGKDHSSARYLETYPSLAFPYVFREEDHNLLKPLEDRGTEIEPEFMLPVVPLQLINGSEGIGTGWSTSIPACLPEDIIKGLRELLEGESLSPLKPGYVGFKGEIIVKDYDPSKKKSKRTKSETNDEGEESENDLEEGEKEDKEKDEESDKEVENDEEEVDDPGLKKIKYSEDVLIDENTKKIMISRGVFTKEGNNIVVTELPIGMWSQRYIILLENMMKKNSKTGKKKIRDYESHAVDNIVKFVIKGFEGKPSYKRLCIERRFSLSNMILLGENYKPTKYDSLEYIMTEFYKFRLPWYQKRKDNLLKEMEKRMEFCRQRVKLLQLIIDKKIKIKNRVKKDVVKQIESFEIDPKIMDGLHLWSITKDDIQKYVDEKEKIEENYEELSNKPPEQLWLADLIDLEKVLIKMKIIPKERASRYINNEDEESDEEEKSRNSGEDEESENADKPKKGKKGKKTRKQKSSKGVILRK